MLFVTVYGATYFSSVVSIVHEFILKMNSPNKRKRVNFLKFSIARRMFLYFSLELLEKVN